MRKSIDQPRYIKAETICIGDTLKITYPANGIRDIEKTYVGTVNSRDRIPPLTTLYYTANNQLLLQHIIGVTPDYRITLLNRLNLENTLATLEMENLK